MKTSFSLFLCSFLFLNVAFSQSSSGAAVFGVVEESETKEPMEFVNVVLYKVDDKTMVDGKSTDHEGQFRFTGVPAGQYYVEVSFIGFETKKSRTFSIAGPADQVDLNNIKILVSSALLEEVEVVAEEATYNMNMDRRTYNVDKDLMSETSTVTEILQNLPSVRVDPNGQISLRGTPNITYLINGRPSAMLRANPATALRQMPANSIERIEVITNPSAKYRPDGVGGIINIVLKDYSGQGWNGTVSASGGNLERYNTNLNLNYGNEDFHFFTNYAYRHANTPQDIFDTRIERDGNGRAVSTFESVAGVTFKENSHLLSGGMDFSPWDGGLIELSGELLYLKSDNLSLTKWNVLEETPSVFSVDRNYDSLEKEYEMGIAFEHEFEEDHALAAEFIYAGYQEDEDNMFNELYTLPAAGNNLSHLLIEKGGPLMEVSVEYARPFGEDSEFEVGYMGNFIKDDIRIFAEDWEAKDWVTDFSKTQRFQFDQKTHAFFGVLGHAIDPFSFSVGLRAEQTYTRSNLITRNEIVPNDYFRLFPSASIAWEMGDYKELQLSYSKRVRRADSDEHNPFPEYDNPRTRDRGNPLLLPEQVHSLELTYRMQTNDILFMPSLYYRYKYDGFMEFRQIVQDSILETTFINFANETAAGMEMVLSGRFKRKIDYNFSINAFYNEVDGSNIGLPGNQSQISWDSKLALNANLSPTTNVQLNAHYISSRLTAQGEFQPMILLNAGLRQDVFQHRGALFLTISDVFASVEFETQINNPNLFWNTRYGRNNQIVQAGFSYRFGKGYAKKREKLAFDDELEDPKPQPEKEDEEEEE